MNQIYEVLTEIGYNLKDFGASYRARPLYRESNNDTSLAINKETGKWVDFSVNIHGSLEDLVKLTLNLKDINEAKQWLEKKIDIEVLKKNDKPKVKQIRVYPKELLNELVPNHNYWIERGISKETLLEFGGGLSKKGQMANRYVFPIVDNKDRLIGFAGRDVFNNTDRPKWKLLQDKLSWFYPSFGIDNIRKKKEVIIVESIGDCLALWDAGIKNILVLFGTQLGAYRLKILLKLDCNKIFLALNNDESQPDNIGLEASKKIKGKLLNFFDENQIGMHLPTKKDFGEMTKEEILAWYESRPL